jgi:hypothetical protein
MERRMLERCWRASVHHEGSPAFPNDASDRFGLDTLDAEPEPDPEE